MCVCARACVCVFLPTQNKKKSEASVLRFLLFYLFLFFGQCDYDFMDTVEKAIFMWNMKGDSTKMIEKNR